MEILVSLSDVKPGRNERTLVSLFNASGCTPVQAQYNGKANRYACTNWSPVVFAKIKRAGWEAQPGQAPNQHGQYHLIHLDDEICVITPEPGHTFVLEFPAL